MTSANISTTTDLKRTNERTNSPTSFFSRPSRDNEKVEHWTWNIEHRTSKRKLGFLVRRARPLFSFYGTKFTLLSYCAITSDLQCITSRNGARTYHSFTSLLSRQNGQPNSIPMHEPPRQLRQRRFSIFFCCYARSVSFQVVGTSVCRD